MEFWAQNRSMTKKEMAKSGYAINSTRVGGDFFHLLSLHYVFFLLLSSHVLSVSHSFEVCPQHIRTKAEKKYIEW